VDSSRRHPAGDEIGPGRRSRSGWTAPCCGEWWTPSVSGAGCRRTRPAPWRACGATWSRQAGCSPPSRRR